jgi:hypothetical protein
MNEQPKPTPQMNQLQQSIQGYSQQPPPLPEPPQTYVIECNKVNAMVDGHAYRVDDTTGKQLGSANVWTNNFPPIKLKKGDMVSVNSAFLSARGGGDLLQFDTTNNKTRIMFEYYATNDKTNGKRSAVDIKGSDNNTPLSPGTPSPTPSPYQYYDKADPGGSASVDLRQPTTIINCYPSNYRPMKLLRLMETYKDNVLDYPGSPKTNTMPYTHSGLAMPFYSKFQEPNWGYIVGESKSITNASEDLYIPGLYRTPMLNIRENMFYQTPGVSSESGGPPPPPDPSTESFTGTSINGLSIWYVSTPLSAYGAANSDATMRIYFSFGKTIWGENGEYVDHTKAVQDLIGRLRVGETIQWLNTENWCGTGTAEKNKNDTNIIYIPPHVGTPNPLQQILGPNVYVCSGYAMFGDGFQRPDRPASNGVDPPDTFQPAVPGFDGRTTVDQFTQIGNGTHYYDGSYKNPMGMLQKVIRTNLGATGALNNVKNVLYNKANPLYYPHTNIILPRDGFNMADGQTSLNEFTDDDIEKLPWIEVSCEKSISFCYGDPNHWNRLVSTGHTGNRLAPWYQQQFYVPFPGLYNAAGYSLTASNYMSGLNLIGLRTWSVDSSYNMSNTYLTQEIYDASLLPHTVPGVFGDFTEFYKKGDGAMPPTIGPKDRTKFYWCYSPQYFSPATLEDSRYMTTGPYSSGTQLEVSSLSNNPNIVSTPQKFREAVGLEQSIYNSNQYQSSVKSYNYNVSNVGTDYPSDSKIYQKYGWDMWDPLDPKFAGSRVPSYFKPDSNDYDPTTYSYVTRQHSMNQGEYYWKEAPPDSERENYQAPPSEGVNNITRTGGTWIWNPNIQGYFRDTQGESGREVSFRNKLAGQNINAGGDVWIVGSNSKTCKFFFPYNIFSGPSYDGNPPADWGANMNYVARGEGNINAYNGVNNYICQAHNLPSSYYNSKINKVNGVWVNSINDTEGIFYGYLHNPDPVAGETEWWKFRSPSVSGPERECLDFPSIMAQFPSEFYAKFTNPANGDTEIMYCKTCPHNLINTTDLDTTGTRYTPTANGYTVRYPNPIFTSGHVGAVGGDGTGVDSPNGGATDTQYRRPCSLLIIKRDIQGTGMKFFSGMIDQPHNNYGPGSIDPLYLTPTATVDSYFEILNGWGNMETTFKADGMKRDLMSFTPNNFMDNPQFITNFQPATALVQQYGTPCGGDFYLTKEHSLPYVEKNTGKQFFNSNIYRVNSSLLKMGSPTRSVVASSGGNEVEHTGRYSWDTHYDYVDLELDIDNMYSPTDISNLITDQLHTSQDLYYSYKSNGRPGGRYSGGQVPNTSSKYKLNSLFRQIHGPSSLLALESKATGALAGLYAEGDFCYMSDVNKQQIINSISALGWQTGGVLQGQWDDVIDLNPAPTSGQYPVWIRNNVTFVNVAPSTNFYKVPGFVNGETYGSNIPVLWSNTDWVKRLPYTELIYVGQNIVLCPEYAGSSNAQLNYNTDISKFEWKFFHQPVYSDYVVDDATGSGIGGKVVSRQWATAIDGVDNWDRHGGINVVNWSIPIVEFGGVFNRRDIENLQNPLTYVEPVGAAFMNKLGFNNYWMTQNVGEKVGGYVDTVGWDLQNDYNPLGTTRSDVDVSETRPYLQMNPRMVVKVERVAPISKGGGLAYLNRAIAFNMDTLGKSLTSGLPRNFYNYNNSAIIEEIDPATGIAPVTKPFNYGWKVGDTYAQGDAQKLLEIGAAQGYGPNVHLSTPPSVVYASKADGPKIDGTAPTVGTEMLPIKLNMDDVKHPYLETECDSSALRATELPKKTTIGYFLIMSDLIDRHEFIGSANNGSPLKCLGILSKNYENNDFFFSFQSPVQFYVKQDRVITSIRTEIVTPTLETPVGLDFNSSIIYTIVRQQTEPEADVAPLALTQAYDYALMEQIANQQGVDLTTINGALVPTLSAEELEGVVVPINELRQNLVDAVLHPTDQQSAIIARTQSEISDNLSRMSYRERSELIGRMGISENPTEVSIPPLPMGLRESGEGAIQLQQHHESFLAPGEHTGQYGMNADQIDIAFNQTREPPMTPASLIPDASGGGIDWGSATKTSSIKLGKSFGALRGTPIQLTEQIGREIQPSPSENRQRSKSVGSMPESGLGGSRGGSLAPLSRQTSVDSAASSSPPKRTPPNHKGGSK